MANKPIIALCVSIWTKQHNNAIKRYKTSIVILLSTILIRGPKQAKPLSITGNCHPHRYYLPPIPNKHVSSTTTKAKFSLQTILLIIISSKYIFTFSLMFNQAALGRDSTWRDKHGDD